MSTWRNFMAGRLVVLALVVSPWAVATAAVTKAGVVEGEVTGKREAFEMPGGDRWRHVYEITYRYQPAGAPYPATGKDTVDLALYRRLRVGSRVSVSYGPQRLFGFPMGVESHLSDASALSRIPFDSGWPREAAEVAGLVMVALLAFLAYRRKSQPLGLAAGLAGGTWVSSVLAAGFLVFPLLFWMWRRNRGQGYGWLLLGTMAVSTAALYWRLPQPEPMPSGPTRNAAGVVRHMRIVDTIWDTDEGGQRLRHPFQMLEVEFTPDGGREPVHILDCVDLDVDLDSGPGLREGAAVQVLYPISDPGAARIEGTTRTYAEKALVYLLGLTYGLGAVVAFVIGPALFLVERVWRRYQGSVAAIPLDHAVKKMSNFPADDPRKALEAFIRAQRAKQGHNDTDS